MNSDAFGALLTFLLGGALMLGGLAIGGLQCFWYLQDGTWTSLSFIDVAARYLDVPWARYPTEWFGLHTILSYIPVGLVAFLVGVGLLSASDA